MASFLEVLSHGSRPQVDNLPKPKRMYHTEETVILGTAMEERWKSLQTDQQGHDREEGLVFYKDMRFWLILLMLVAFFTFTLIGFP